MAEMKTRSFLGHVGFVLVVITLATLAAAFCVAVVSSAHTIVEKQQQVRKGQGDCIQPGSPYAVCETPPQ